MAYSSKSKPKADNAALKRLKQDLKEDSFQRLYVFHGEEAYLKEYYLNAIKKKLVPAGLEEFNFHSIPGKECTVQSLTQAVDCLPVLSERTMVLVTDLDLFGGTEKTRAGLMELFRDLPDYCCVVFFYDLLPYKSNARMKMATALKECGTVVEFTRQEESDLVNWIVRHVRSMDHDISNQDAKYLIQLCGELMNNLFAELEKIGAYATHRQITRQDIDAVAIPQVDAMVYEMTNAIARKDFDRAAAVLNDLLSAQEPPIKLLSVTGKYFRQLYTARLLYERRKGVRELMDMWNMRQAWQADRLMDAAKRYSLSWCRHAIRRCGETDVAMKTASGDERELLVSLLMELANVGRSA